MVELRRIASVAKMDLFENHKYLIGILETIKVYANFLLGLYMWYYITVCKQIIIIIIIIIIK